MIKFSNGYTFTFACGSGALSFDGRGWPWDKPFIWLGLLDPTKFVVVAKTVTLEPKIGNLSLWHPWTSVRLIKPRSAVNAVGLTNPGLKVWIKKYCPRACHDIALSLKIDTEFEATSIISLLRGLEFSYIELNISCPNDFQFTGHYVNILKILSEQPSPLVLKLSKAQIKPALIQATEPYVEAFHAINTVPWTDIFEYADSPIYKYNKIHGGISGEIIKYEALKAVSRLSNMTSKPIIGGGGIGSLQDIQNMEIAGANAFSIGTLFLYKPWRPNQIIKQYYKTSSPYTPSL